MNLHEYQGKDLLGVLVLEYKEVWLHQILNKLFNKQKNYNLKQTQISEFVKAQIHAGGRGRVEV